MKKDYVRKDLFEINSTNDYIKKIKHDSTDYIVTAEEQTKGKGRLGRNFISEAGGLYFSVSYTPKAGIAPDDTLHYTALCAIAVRRALLSITGTNFDIKWPNDVYLYGKKVCGILTEAVHTNDRFYIIFGIGINLENDISKDISYASSIKELIGVSIDKEVLLNKICDELLNLLSQCPTDFSPIIAEYVENCVTIGKNVKGKSVFGKAIDVDDKAFLLIETENGSVERLFFGEAIES